MCVYMYVLCCMCVHMCVCVYMYVLSWLSCGTLQVAPLCMYVFMCPYYVLSMLDRKFLRDVSSKCALTTDNQR